MRKNLKFTPNHVQKMIKNNLIFQRLAVWWCTVPFILTNESLTFDFKIIKDPIY